MHIFINIGQAQMGGGERGASKFGGEGPLPPSWSRHWGGGSQIAVFCGRPLWTAPKIVVNNMIQLASC